MSGHLPWGPETDLAALRDATVTAVDNAYTRGERKAAVFHGRHADLAQHLNELRGEFLGQAELLFAHAAVIVALRRGHDLPRHVPLFHRLWEEQGAVLRAGCSLRWLVSACDSFADHAADPARRALALVGVVLVNSVKLQETERELLGLRGQATPLPARPATRALFDGLTAFGIAKGDMVENMAARIRAAAAGDAVLGPLLEELLARLAANDTVFRRFDAARAALPVPPGRRLRPLLGRPPRSG